MPEDLRYLPASEALKRFSARSLSPVEWLEALLGAAAASAPLINSTTAIHAEYAMNLARESERRWREGTARPLEGVPVAIKEETAVAGWRRTIGSHLFDEIPALNHPIVDKLLAAGAIPHLQTTVPEFCVIGQTWSPRWGVSRNPWNTAVTCGGSSGGSGAALAAGLAPLATGSDMAGSIRIPAALQGLYGYKPPFGRLAATPGEELFVFAVEGPMTRTFEDLVRMQNAIAGPHASSYSTLPFAALPLDYADLRGWRLAYSFETGCSALCPDTRANMQRAFDGLRDRGAAVEPVDIRWDNAELAQVLIEGIFALFFNEYLRGAVNLEDARMSGYLRLLIGKYGHRPDSIAACAQLAARLQRQMHEQVWSRGFRALLCPTLFTTDIAADLDITRQRCVQIQDRSVDSYLGWVGTPPFNLLSRYPAIAVPTGLARNSVPTSMQIVAAPFEDETAFRVAANHAAAGTSKLFLSVFPESLPASP